MASLPIVFAAGYSFIASFGASVIGTLFFKPSFATCKTLAATTGTTAAVAIGVGYAIWNASSLLSYIPYFGKKTSVNTDIGISALLLLCAEAGILSVCIGLNLGVLTIYGFKFLLLKLIE